MAARRNIMKVVTVLVAVVTVVLALYIMAHGLGLSRELDFGAGAYYYADIPGFEKIFRDDAYSTTVPLWVHIVLFLGLGWLMYRLWCRIEQGGKEKRHHDD